MLQLQKRFLCGSYPPLLTPFRDGKVDFKKFAQLTERQVREGSHGVLVCGTTGEPASLTMEERTELLKVALEITAKRIPVVAATGSQSLAETLELTKRAEQAGADALLVVTPYYCKPSQRGLVEYFVTVAERTALPIMIYHIPGRTAVTVTVATVTRIAERAPNLVGMKHAANDLEFVTKLILSLGPEFRIFCGLEALSLPMLVVGAKGLMSAVSNIAPMRVAELYNAVDRGDLEAARKLHNELFELNESIFLDTNPIPLKYMMNRLGLLDSSELRLPLVSLDSHQAPILDSVLARAGLLQAAGSRAS
jgi:4-hydroxy-tetrahydrodipicolinate synthase